MPKYKIYIYIDKNSFIDDIDIKHFSAFCFADLIGVHDSETDTVEIRKDRFQLPRVVSTKKWYEIISSNEEM